MPIKVVNRGKKGLAKEITIQQIQQLFDRYHECTKKRKKKGGASHDHDKAVDTKCGWFSLPEILALLTANNVSLDKPETYGIRIYFGHHHPDNDFQPDPTPRMPKEKYYHLDTPILVVTKKNTAGKNEDCLTEDVSLISISPFEGMGEDNSKLCPPECNDGEAIK